MDTVVVYFMMDCEEIDFTPRGELIGLFILKLMIFVT